MDSIRATCVSDIPTDTSSRLDRRKHVERLIEGLTGELSKHFEKLVPAQTWTVYWITHSLALLEQPQFLDNVTEDVIEFIKECAHKDGGYGGGPGQIAHLATTFAAVNALVTTSSEEALESIDRVSLVRFLHRMKQLEGSFTMHDDGEIDSRATYCALTLLRCLNIQDPILLENAAEWILSCQTYEGGFGSVPGSEAHGGYTFCCVASLCLLNQLQRADLPALMRWLSSKQLSVEGGFCGRSNKLVDSCYSYWQGAVFPLVHSFLKKNAKTKTFCSKVAEEEDENNDNLDSKMTYSETTSRRTTRSTSKAKERTDDGSQETDCRSAQEMDKLLDSWVFDCAAIQDYVLNQCQAKGGLLRDKPGAIPDFYHTCYALSGLSLSQHQPDGSLFDLGSKPINILGPTHPLFNLTLDSLNNCFLHFSNKKIQTYEEVSQSTRE